jgi:hypothetical protein
MPALRYDLVANPARFNKGFDQAEKRATGFGKAMSRIGGAAAGLFAGGALIAGVKKVADAGSDLNETVNKTGLAFGRNAGAIQAWATGSAKSMGLPKQAALEGASSFGLLFSKIGIGAADTAKMSTAMVQLAVDLGSVHNADPTQIIEAQTAAFRGEYDALQQFVPAINAAAVETEALAQTHKRSAKELTDAEKAQAVYSIMLKQTTKEQGDFARTSGESANKIKQNAARVKDLQANVGTLLLPALTAAAGALGTMADWVERNKGAATVLGVAVVALTGFVVAAAAAEKLMATWTTAATVATKLRAATTKLLGRQVAAQVVADNAAAVSASRLATATTASGAAAATSAGKFALLGGAGGLGLLGAAAVVVGVSFSKLVGSLKAAAAENERYGRTATVGGKGGQLFAERVTALGKATDVAAGATHGKGLEDAYAATQQEALRLEMVKAVPAYQTAADKVALNAEKATELAGKLAELKRGFADQVTATKEAVLGYDGLIAKSGVTAAQVVRDLRNQVTNFKTYSADVKRLIKAGVSPAAIQELSVKGPQYVHALATGSNRELQAYKRHWRDRQAEVKGSFATSMQQQYANLVAKIRAMQRQIDSLRGKNIPITAQAKVSVAKSTVEYLRTFHVKAPQLAGGGRITAGTGPTADDVLARLSKGETVVSARDSARPEFQAWAKAQGIPGFATGGALSGRNLGRIRAADIAATRVMGQRLAGGMAGALGPAIARAIDKAAAAQGVAGGGGGGTATGATGSVNQIAQRTAGLLRRAGEWMSWARRIMFESGGNWRAINRWDSNWRAGHPSVGGAQVIRGTFAAYAGPYRNVGPFAYGVSMNPLANSYAGANYAVHRYGSLRAVDPRVRPRGYDGGNTMPPGLSLSWNGTGRPEPLVPARRPRSGGDIHVHLHGNVYGDRAALVSEIRSGIRAAQRRDGVPATQQVR